jgi:hypothetical protein
MQRQLNWVVKNKPEANTERKQALISELDAICRAYEKLAMCHVGGIWQKLMEAKDQNSECRYSTCVLPLKPTLPEYHESTQIVIDLCGYNLDPYAYDYCRENSTRVGLRTGGQTMIENKLTHSMGLALAERPCR